MWELIKKIFGKQKTTEVKTPEVEIQDIKIFEHNNKKYKCVRNKVGAYVFIRESSASFKIIGVYDEVNNEPIFLKTFDNEIEFNGKREVTYTLFYPSEILDIEDTITLEYCIQKNKNALKMVDDYNLIIDEREKKKLDILNKLNEKYNL